MTTAHSPLSALRSQADRMAAVLKAASRGARIAHDPGGKLAAALQRESITFGVVMDDKVLKIEMPWELIRECTEAGIAEYIIKQMQRPQ
jgi:hypothetical protein